MDTNLIECIRKYIREESYNQELIGISDLEAFVIPKPPKLKTSKRKNKSVKPWTITQNHSRG